MRGGGATVNVQVDGVVLWCRHRGACVGGRQALAVPSCGQRCTGNVSPILTPMCPLRLGLRRKRGAGTGGWEVRSGSTGPA